MRQRHGQTDRNILGVKTFTSNCALILIGWERGRGGCCFACFCFVAVDVVVFFYFFFFFFFFFFIWRRVL